MPFPGAVVLTGRIARCILIDGAEHTVTRRTPPRKSGIFVPLFYVRGPWAYVQGESLKAFGHVPCAVCSTPDANPVGWQWPEQPKHKGHSHDGIDR